MMMTQILPASIEALNMQETIKDSTVAAVLLKKTAFDDILVEKKLKREVSLPNGVENWNISNFDSYLNFEDNVIGNNFDVIASPEDRMVPEGESRDRCGSISSVSSFVDEKRPIFHNFGVKTISTVCMDSGSTCISSDHSYFSSSSLQKGLDPEETYQSLDMFLQEVPEVTMETLSSSFSPMPSTSSSDSNFDIPTSLDTSYPSFSSIDAGQLKRPLDSISEDEVFLVKHTKQEYSDSFESTRYLQVRKKNNMASKNCRKTRKEKQKDMEQRVSELEQERESLQIQVKVLEEQIEASKRCLLNVIAQRQ